MDPMTEFFGYLCGQGRCFVADGLALPVCQRCFGLYVGAALTGAWLLLSGAWRYGLPGRAVGWLNALVLLTAMLGGLHAIDLGPTWRLACGLWTGHVVTFWLIGAAVQIARTAHPRAAALPPWPRAARWQALAAAPVLAGLALAWPAVGARGWGFWAALVVAGAGCLAAAVAAAGAAVIARGVTGLWRMSARRTRG